MPVRDGLVSGATGPIEPRPETAMTMPTPDIATRPAAEAPARDLERLRLPSVAPGERIVVAMSGGVDSSTVAAAMTALGYDVIGVTLQLYDHGAAVKKAGACCAGQDIHDARRVAESLDIPHYVLDYEDRFRRAVIDDFVASYRAGRTPIPCVLCNERVKFADLLDMARDLDAACLVTGHYVRWSHGADGPELHRAVDRDRDQSYFLYRTTRAQLDRVRFPLGALDKRETRALAERFGLVTASKPDSQDICFVPDGRYSDVIAKLSPGAAQPGDIVHEDGRVLGRHDSIIHFTIGQRRGLNVATGAPLYVLRLDADRNRVIVGPRDSLATRRIAVQAVNWLGDGTWPDVAARGLPVRIKVRSTRPPVPATVRAIGPASAEVTIAGSEEGVAPGQACVFYDADPAETRMFGGGWIAGNQNN